MIRIDMQMPKNCLDCPACNEYLMCAIPCDGRGFGENDVRDFSENRPEWCPMKEQEAVVRCKDCKHYNADGCSQGFGWCENREHGSIDDWFCADGKKKNELCSMFDEGVKK